MKRRELLHQTGLIGGISLGAGCVGSSPLGNGETPSSTGADSPTASEEPTPTERGQSADPTQTERSTPTPTPVVAGLPRVDQPPYEITDTECNSGLEDPPLRCANMPAEPSLSFQQEAIGSSVLDGEGLGNYDSTDSDRQFYATLLTSMDDLDRVYENEYDRAAITLIEETDFDTHAVLVVETGWSTTSRLPHLKRIERTDDGIHAYGCRLHPCGGDGVAAIRSSVARFERPDPIESAVVSYTYDADTRVNFAAGEGVVSLSDLGP